MSGSSGPLVLGVNDSVDEAVVGGKLARQRVMARHGFSVPRFFCLTTALFERMLAPLEDEIAHAIEQTDFSDPMSVRQTASKLHQRIQSLTIEAGDARTILTAFDDAFDPTTLVAVRASTVAHAAEESEDAATNPFAGISDTFLYVHREDVLRTIPKCWASGFGEAALLYRHAAKMDPLGFAVAVAVQEMVAGERSFLLFTCNPKTAARESVIVAGHGIGEGIVQERVGVDHYFVPNDKRTIRAELGEKAERITLDRAHGRGTKAEPVSDQLRTTACLTNEEILKLVELGKEIEKVFGAPQDIEGTITSDGRIHFLQARPIALEFGRVRIWSNANVTESFPGVTTALTYSFARFFYRIIFYDCYRRLGIRGPALHDEHEWLDRMIGFLSGRVYYCLSAFYRLHSQSPLFPIFRANWEKMMGFSISYRTPHEGFFSRVSQRVLLVTRVVSAGTRILWAFATHERAMAHFYRWWDDLVAPLRGQAFESTPPLTLLGEFHRVWRAVGNEWGVTLLNDTYLPMFYGFTEKAFARWKLSEEQALLSDLLCGDDEIVSVEIVYSVVRLAECVRNDARLSAVFASCSPEEVWQSVLRGELDGSFTAAVHKHVHDYGDRGFQELKMEQPNVRHEPTTLIRAIKGYIAANVSEKGMRETERAVRQKGEERLDALLAGYPLRRAIVGYLLSTLRSLIRHRENSRYRRSELFGVSKNVFRALGRALVRANVLCDPDDVVHLTQDEIFGWFDGTGVTRDLAALVEVRRRERTEHEAIEPEMDITTFDAVGSSVGRPVPKGVATTHVLSGLGSSTGVVRGRARIVLDPTAVESIGSDTILVARETDPGWLFLMLAAKGIVVERGSMLSHTAITGRKFGIPTVVAVPSATTRICDGDRIEIDGAAGTVRILHDIPADDGAGAGERAQPRGSTGSTSSSMDP